MQKIKQAQNQLYPDQRAAQPGNESIHHAGSERSAQQAGLRQVSLPAGDAENKASAEPVVPQHVQVGGRAGWGIDELRVGRGPVCGADAAATAIDAANGCDATTTATTIRTAMANADVGASAPTNERRQS